MLRTRFETFIGKLKGPESQGHRTRTRRLVLVALAILAVYAALGLAGASLIVVAGTYAYRTQSLASLKAMILFAMAAGVTVAILLPVARRGQVRLASMVLLFVLLVGGTASAATGRLLHDPAMLIYPMCIIAAGLLLGQAGIVVFTLLSALLAGGLYLAEISGALAPVNAPFGWLELMASVEHLVLMAVLMALAIRNINLAEQHLEQEIEARVLELRGMLGTVETSRQSLAQAHRQLLMVQEQEQRRLSHELHDGAVQQLIAITYLLGDVKGDDPVIAQALDATRQEIRTVVNQLRALTGKLRPPGLDEVGLAVALENYVSRLMGPKAPQIETQLDPVGTADVSEAVAICLFRVAQEALHNAIRHAGASHVRMTLRHPGDKVWLSVSDNGRGFEAPDDLRNLAQADHFGLVNMSERVKSIGGETKIRSVRGKGTEIEVVVCLPGPSAGKP